MLGVIMKLRPLSVFLTYFFLPRNTLQTICPFLGRRGESDKRKTFLNGIVCILRGTT